MIKHIVLFKLKDASPEIVARTVEVLRGMQGKVEQLRSLEVGTDVIRSPVPMTLRSLLPLIRLWIWKDIKFIRSTRK